jgi:hypothetical protein
LPTILLNGDNEKLAKEPVPCRQASHVRDQSTCAVDDICRLDGGAGYNPNRSLCVAGRSDRTTDIGGTVVGASGPEAGVWVIAETTELPTKFARIVVTDDQGRYLVPDLPAANYSVWVRGYGLVDSAKLTAKPGQLLNGGAGTERRGSGALLPGDLLVCDDENSACRRFWRQERHSRKADAD